MARAQQSAEAMLPAATRTALVGEGLRRVRAVLAGVPATQRPSH